MAWRAVSPDLTEEARLPDEEGAPSFTVGFWPPRESERFGALLVKLRKPADGLDPVKDYEAYAREIGLTFDVYRDMAKFGVRGWSGLDLPPAKTETVKIYGVDHVVLSDESLHWLGVQRLLGVVALRAFAFNVLSEAQKKTSNSPSDSPSSTSHTDAETATPK